jgi:hypothetical protein
MSNIYPYISHIGTRTYLSLCMFGGVNAFTPAMLHPERSRGRLLLNVVNKNQFMLIVI